MDDSNQPDFDKCFDALVCLKLGARIQNDSNECWDVVAQYVQMHELNMFEGAHHLLKTRYVRKMIIDWMQVRFTEQNPNNCTCIFFMHISIMPPSKGIGKTRRRKKTS